MNTKILDQNIRLKFQLSNNASPALESLVTSQANSANELIP